MYRADREAEYARLIGIYSRYIPNDEAIQQPISNFKGTIDITILPNQERSRKRQIQPKYRGINDRWYCICLGQAESNKLGGGEMKRKSWKQPLKKLTALVLNQVESMNKEELEELLHACKTVSETNCGRQEYQMAHIVKHYTKYRLDGIGGE